MENLENLHVNWKLVEKKRSLSSFSCMGIFSTFLNIKDHHSEVIQIVSTQQQWTTSLWRNRKRDTKILLVRLSSASIEKRGIYGSGECGMWSFMQFVAPVNDNKRIPISCFSFECCSTLPADTWQRNDTMMKPIMCRARKMRNGEKKSGGKFQGTKNFHEDDVV